MGKIRRKRQAMIAILSGVAVIAVIVLAVVWLKPATSTYKPGEDVEGLTTDLNREVPEGAPRITFTDATARAGIRFDHFQGTRNFQLPEDMGSGAAWGDYDRDGWIDLFIVNFAGPITPDGHAPEDSPARCQLYHNNRDGTFTEVSREAGLSLAVYGMAAAWGDYDRDGWPDLVVTAYGGNRLFRNRGDGTFAEVTAKAGFDRFPGYWAGAAWGDYDRDGWLDLYICGYVQYAYQTSVEASKQYDVEVPASINPSSFPPMGNLLFRNNGNGTFSEVAERAGVANPTGRSLSAAWADLDEDGWPDLYVANDVSDNALFKNLGNGKFKEISHGALVADYRGAMGIAVGDWDGDADMDMFITHWIAQENALYSNLFSQLNTADRPLDEVRFMDEADRFGLGQIALDYIGWGTSFIDYDNDGQPDLFVSNGSTFQEKEDPTRLVPMSNMLFWNQGDRDGFFDVSPISGEIFREPRVGRGVAFGDYDRDGDMDWFVVNNGGPGMLWRNDGRTGNHWIEVFVEGKKSNTQGFGTRLRCVSAGRTQVFQIGCQGPYASQNSPIAHIGLGVDTRVDTLVVSWPSGTVQSFVDLPADRVVRIIEGEKNVTTDAPTR